MKDVENQDMSIWTLQHVVDLPLNSSIKNLADVYGCRHPRGPVVVTEDERGIQVGVL